MVVQRSASTGPSFEPIVDVAEDDAVAGRTDVDLDRRPTGDLDGLVANVEGDRCALEQVAAVGVGRVDGLEEQVLRVRVDVRGAPRDPAVVSQDHRRGARERDADDVPGAGGPTVRQWSPFMIQIDGIPKPRCGSLARIGLPLGCPLAGDDPVVRADAVAANEAAAAAEPGHLGHTGRPVGERDQCRRSVLAERRREGEVRHDQRPSPRAAVASRRGTGLAGRGRPAPLPRTFDGVMTGRPGHRPGTARPFARVAQARVGEEPEDLRVDVPAERPGLDLLPRCGVERRPRLQLEPADVVGTREDAGDDERRREAAVVLARSRRSRRRRRPRGCRDSADMASRSRCAAIRQPSVRMYRSVSTWPLPKSSESRPAPMRRDSSICHIRSWAWT